MSQATGQASRANTLSLDLVLQRFAGFSPTQAHFWPLSLFLYHVVESAQDGSPSSPSAGQVSQAAGQASRADTSASSLTLPLQRFAGFPPTHAQVRVFPFLSVWRHVCESSHESAESRRSAAAATGVVPRAAATAASGAARS